MKKTLCIIAFLAATLCKSQTFVSNMENLGLSSGQVYDGSGGGNGFQSGHAFFPTVWDTSFGGFWSAGWVASAKYDSSTIGAANQYGCAAYKGYNNSSAFAMGTTFGNLTVRLTDSLIGKVVAGFYVCNSTYAYKSMRLGDMYAKKFGDTTGTHCGCAQGSYPDWFKLTVKRYYHDTLRNDSIEVYLADYRFSNSAQDYILNTWTWINLSSLGTVDSLAFYLSSSDNGMYGMNTPAYFCVDDLTLANITGIQNHATENETVIYPNPTNGSAEIIYTTPQSNFVTMKVCDVTGRPIAEQKVTSFSGENRFRVDLSNETAGIYYATINIDGNIITKKLIKQ